SIYVHCLNVALISRMIGKWLKIPARDVETLTFAGLLHDIGKSLIPEDLLNKQGKLTNEEYDLLCQHAQLGYDLLRPLPLDSHVKNAALMHHERCDGSGYPGKATTEAIDDYAHIIAIADVYDAMTAARTYRAPLCPFQVIAEFEKDGLQKYKPKYILTFLEHIASTYQNNHVLLSDGRAANIVLLNRHHLSKPLVQLDNGECIDLSRSELYINSLI
ncbi:MAG: HD-GYP domain-containing protein, partial [Eubacterium sp.]|nr:HD-GYP domain-containing protein [Eubacterium sp.]